MKTLFILGGYGCTGKLFTDKFLATSKIKAKLVIAGRREEEAKKYAKLLSDKYKTEVGYAYCDPKKPQTLSAIKGSSMVIVLSPSSEEDHIIVSACAKYKCDYYDIQYSSRKLANLQGLADTIDKSSILCVTDGGYHPGMPAIFARYALTKIPDATHIATYSLIRQQFDKYNVCSDTWKEFADMMHKYECAYYSKGNAIKVSPFSSKGYKKFNFGRYGKESVALMQLEELKLLSKSNPSLIESSFYVGGFNSLTNNVVIPFMMTVGRLFKKLSNKLFAWSLKKTSPPYITMMRTEANSITSKNSFVMEASHEDGYVFTAIACCSFISQYLQGVLPNKGLYVQGMVCKPEMFIEDCKYYGLRIEESKYF